jgi:hypothetical protein
MRWIISAAGVLLAIALLTLALDTPNGSLSRISNVGPARTAINIELDDRPEWRQFIIFSAIQRRADELNRLRELPDTPARSGAAPKIVSLPDNRNSDQKDNDETGVNVQPSSTVTVDIDKSLSLEFPVAGPPFDIDESLPIEFPVAASPETKPRAIRASPRIKARNVRRQVRAPAKRELPRPQNFFEFPFGNQLAKQTPATNWSNYPAAPQTPVTSAITNY